MALPEGALPDPLVDDVLPLERSAVRPLVNLATLPAQDLGRRVADPLRGIDPFALEPAAVNAEVAAVAVERVDQVVGGGDQRTEPLLALLDRCGGEDPFGDLLVRYDDPRRLILRPLHPADPHEEPPDSPVPIAGVLDLELPLLAGEHRLQPRPRGSRLRRRVAAQRLAVGDEDRPDRVVRAPRTLLRLPAHHPGAGQDLARLVEDRDTLTQPDDHRAQQPVGVP